jgi:hypothetical protein
MLQRIGMLLACMVLLILSTVTPAQANIAHTLPSNSSHQSKLVESIGNVAISKSLGQPVIVYESEDGLEKLTMFLIYGGGLNPQKPPTPQPEAILYSFLPLDCLDTGAEATFTTGFGPAYGWFSSTQSDEDTLISWFCPGSCLFVHTVSGIRGVFISGHNASSPVVNHARGRCI